MEEVIRRINELSALARERELTEDEKAERQELRQKYVSAFKANLAAQLDNIYFVEKDGTQHKLQKKSDE